MIFELKTETGGVGVKLIGTRFYYTQVPLKKILLAWNSSLLNF